MVSTRGGARTAPETVPEPELSLRKKPLRKPAANVQSTSAKAETKTSRTKDTKTSKKNVVVRDDEHEQKEAKPVTRKTRKPATRAAADEDDTSHSAATTKDKVPARKTRVVSVREAQSARDAPEPPELKPSATVRATRATRATAAKGKAQPLSPKKITQVSKVRTTKALKSDEKAVTKATRQTSKPVATKRVTRKRAASDENADLDTLESLHDESQPVRAKRQRRTKSVTDDSANAVLELAAPNSKASAEPDSADQEHAKQIIETIPGPEAHEDEDEDEDEDEGDGAADLSLDELCGPKTPMKRCSPRTSFALTSAQKLSYGRTPVRRFEVYSESHRTPQTQRPYVRSQDVFDDPRAMTVARARDRAMVFPKLGALPEIALTYEQTPNEPSTPRRISMVDEKQHNATEMIYEFELSNVEHSRLEDSTAGLESEQCDDTQFDTSIATGADASHTELTTMDDVQVHALSPYNASMSDGTSPIEHSPHPDDGTSVLTAAPLDHIESHDAASQSGETTPVDHLDLESTSQIGATATKAQRLGDLSAQDNAIQIDFDGHLHPSPVLPQFDHTERLSLLPSESIATSLDDQFPVGESAQATPTPQKLENGRSSHAPRQSLNDTINFSDFIDASTPSAGTRTTYPIKAAHIHAQSADAQSPVVSPNPQQQVTDASDETNVVQDDSDAQQISVTDPRTPVKFGIDGQHGVILTSNSSSSHRASARVLTDYKFTFELQTPHYALPTVASRRKSLPVMGYASPAKHGARPQTSDGVGIAMLSDHAAVASVSRGGCVALATPRQETGPVRFDTIPKIRVDYQNLKSTPVAATTMRPCRTEGPRPRQPIDVDRSIRLHATPTRPRTSRPAKCADSVCAAIPRAASSISPEVAPRSIESRKRKRNFEEHARTAMPATRFQDISMSNAPRRPMTAKKPISMRERAMRGPTMCGSYTPTKTPLKAPAMTPGMVPMTPHPHAPLRGIVALVEVFTNEGASASSSFTALLQRLGARTTKTWSDRLTHVVFKDGSPTTLQRLRIHNKTVADKNTGSSIYCVNSRWVSDCDAEGFRLDESDEAYAVDVDDVPRAGKRRRVSMEPSALINVDGNVVRDRKTSLGRSTLNRLSLKPASPEVSELFDSGDKLPHENKYDEDESWSPSTPAYLTAPTSLVQQTAPINRIRKLDFGGKGVEKKTRRLTFWNGGA